MCVLVLEMSKDAAGLTFQWVVQIITRSQRLLCQKLLQRVLMLLGKKMRERQRGRKEANKTKHNKQQSKLVNCGIELNDRSLMLAIKSCS